MTTPRTRTLLQLRTECRQRVEQEGSAFVSDAELTRYLNQSIAKLYGKLVRARGDQYYRSSKGFVTVAGTPTIAQPDAFFKLLGVDVTVNGVLRSLEPVDWSRRAMYQAGTSAYLSDEVSAYSIEGANLRLYPTPASVYAVTVWFIPYATELSIDADTFDGINGWEHYAVLDACIAMLDKEESSSVALREERKHVEELIDELAGSRDEASAWRVERRWSSRGSTVVGRRMR